MDQLLRLKTTRITMVAMFVALMVGIGWALAMVPNVEFTTILAFTAGATLGPFVGAITAATGMFFHSAANPMGSGLAFPVLLAAQVSSYLVIGFVGGLFSKVRRNTFTHLGWRILLAIIGLLVTLLYDGLTSISFPLMAGASALEIKAVLIAGLAFTTLHQLANTALFFTLAPRLISIGRSAYHRGDSLPPATDATETT